MSQELIPTAVQLISGQKITTVNARELHNFLEVGKVYAAWIQERIKEYNFSENDDFVVFSESGKNPKGGRPSKEYFITLDMAKELSMIERTDKGRLARKYFIECERRLKNISNSKALPPSTLNPEQQWKIQQAISEKVYASGDKAKLPALFKYAYRALKCRYNVAKYDQIPTNMLDDAIDFIKGIEFNGVLAPVISTANVPTLLDDNNIQLIPFRANLVKPKIKPTWIVCAGCGKTINERAFGKKTPESPHGGFCTRCRRDVRNGKMNPETEAAAMLLWMFQELRPVAGKILKQIAANA